VDETGEYPAEQLKLLGQQGLMGLHIPEAYGGTASGSLAFCLAAEEIAWACASTSTIFLVQNLGGYPIIFAGTEEQKRRYLPKLASGEMTAAFSLSEPGSGSDAAAMTCRAVRNGDRYVLNGSKMWVTNGSHAGIITVFVTTDPGKRAKGDRARWSRGSRASRSASRSGSSASTARPRWRCTSPTARFQWRTGSTRKGRGSRSR
jgi:alkylation response protein AidB-like acyl-CoA dehydrogenase